MEQGLTGAGSTSLKRRKGLVIVNTGNGKGKTTAALGLLFRAWGHGMKVAMLQFLKSDAECGEHLAARRIGLEVITHGSGFVRRPEDIEKGRKMALELWEMAKDKVLSGQYDMIVLDEFSYPLKLGWLAVDDVLDVLRRRPPTLHVIITGRDIPAGILDFADLVTEMREVKHPFRQGVVAQKGIEF